MPGKPGSLDYEVIDGHFNSVAARPLITDQVSPNQESASWSLPCNTNIKRHKNSMYLSQTPWTHGWNVTYIIWQVALVPSDTKPGFLKPVETSKIFVKQEFFFSILNLRQRSQHEPCPSVISNLVDCARVDVCSRLNCVRVCVWNNDAAVPIPGN